MYSDENTLFFEEKGTFWAPPSIVAGVSRLFHPKTMLRLEIAWGREAGLDQLLSKYWNSIGIVLDIVLICKYWWNIWHLFDGP